MPLNRRQCLRILGTGLVLPPALVHARGSRDDLLQALRASAVVFYLRHGATNWNGDDQLDGPRDRQRLLVSAGEAQAHGVGEAFRRHHINAARVIASPFERCKDTATNAFGRVDELAPNLVRQGRRPGSGQHAAPAAARDPASGRNLVIVAHHDNFREVTGTSLPETGGAVLRPVGSDPGWRLRGVLTPVDCTRLAQA